MQLQKGQPAARKVPQTLGEFNRWKRTDASVDCKLASPFTFRSTPGLAVHDFAREAGAAWYASFAQNFPLSLEMIALSWPAIGGRLLIPRLVSDFPKTRRCSEKPPSFSP